MAILAHNGPAPARAPLGPLTAPPLVVRAPAVVQVRLLAGTDAALEEAIARLTAALPGQIALGKSGKPGQYGQRRAYGTLTLAAPAEHGVRP
jgi:hypothetical protein